jgi:hypothetical protein
MQTTEIWFARKGKKKIVADDPIWPPATFFHSLAIHSINILLIQVRLAMPATPAYNFTSAGQILLTDGDR